MPSVAPRRDPGRGRTGDVSARGPDDRARPPRSGPRPGGRRSGAVASAGGGAPGGRQALRRGGGRAPRQGGDRHQEPGRVPRGGRSVRGRHDLRRGPGDPAARSDPSASRRATRHPAAPAREPTRARPPAERGATRSRWWTIRSASASSSAQMLEQAGFDVRTTADGGRGAACWTKRNVDVVVTDLEMPRLNGYELIEDLRRRPATRDVPVVVLTTRAGAKHVDLARRLGVAALRHEAGGRAGVRDPGAGPGSPSHGPGWESAMSARGGAVDGPVGAPVRVLVAGDARATRSALRRMLGADRRLEVVGLAADADEVSAGGDAPSPRRDRARRGDGRGDVVTTIGG